MKLENIQNQLEESINKFSVNNGLKIHNNLNYIVNDDVYTLTQGGGTGISNGVSVENIADHDDFPTRMLIPNNFLNTNHVYFVRSHPYGSHLYNCKLTMNGGNVSNIDIKSMTSIWETDNFSDVLSNNAILNGQSLLNNLIDDLKTSQLGGYVNQRVSDKDAFYYEYKESKLNYLNLKNQEGGFSLNPFTWFSGKKSESAESAQTGGSEQDAGSEQDGGAKFSKGAHVKHKTDGKLGIVLSNNKATKEVEVSYEDGSTANVPEKDLFAASPSLFKKSKESHGPKQERLKSEIEAAKQKVEAAKQKSSERSRSVSPARSEFKSSEKQLKDAQKQEKDALQKLNSARTLLNRLKQQKKAAEAKKNADAEKARIAAAEKTAEEKVQNLAQSESSTKQTVSEKQKVFNAAKKVLSEREKELKLAEAEITKARRELKAKEAQLTRGVAKHGEF